jgi:hypothetical protein
MGEHLTDCVYDDLLGGDPLQAERRHVEKAEARLRETAQERDAALSDRLHLARDLKAAREALENIRREARLWLRAESPHLRPVGVIEELHRLAVAALQGDRP